MPCAQRFAKGNRAEPLPGARWTRMRRIYTSGGKPASRNLTIADLRAAKGKRKFTQVTASTADEAAAASEADIDIITTERAPSPPRSARAHRRRFSMPP